MLELLFDTLPASVLFYTGLGEPQAFCGYIQAKALCVFHRGASLYVSCTGRAACSAVLVMLNEVFVPFGGWHL